MQTKTNWNSDWYILHFTQSVDTSGVYTTHPSTAHWLNAIRENSINSVLKDSGDWD